MKWICKNDKCKKPCYAEPPERCHPTGCLLSKNNNPNWRKEDDQATTSSHLPKLTAEVFDREDCPAWTKYAIERPDPEFPEWCQKGRWVCAYDRFKKEWEYFKVNETKRNCISSDNGLEYSFCDLKQARLRPYNAEEMRGLIGKVVERYSSAYLVISYAHDNLATTVYIEGKYLSADNLLRDFTIDGKPCGVLEHLENGGWVK